MIVDFVHRTSKPETPTAGIFYWVEDSTGSQIWFAPSKDPSELILLNGYEGFDDLIERLGTLEGKVDKLPNEKKLTWQVIK